MGCKSQETVGTEDGSLGRVGIPFDGGIQLRAIGSQKRAPRLGRMWLPTWRVSWEAGELSEVTAWREDSSAWECVST